MQDYKIKEQKGDCQELKRKDSGVMAKKYNISVMQDKYVLYMYYIT